MTAPGQAAIARAHRMLGRDFHLINYRYDTSGGETNPYADGDWVRTDDSPQTVSATIDFGTEPTRSSNGGSGVDVEFEAVIYLQADDVTIRAGTGDRERATTLVDTGGGGEYRVVAVEEQLHLTAVHVEAI